MMKYSKILVVDNSGFTRRVIRTMLEDDGYWNLDEASDGSQAIALMAQRNYALVISDWNMAPMSGLDLLMRMRATPRWRHIPFIMATAHSQRKFASIARDNGATHYLTKPFTSNALMERIWAVFAMHVAA